LIIDAHAHVSDTDFGNAETLLKQYENAGVDKGILVPGGMLDVRKMTRYITGQESPASLDVPNHLIEKAIRKYPDKFHGFYCVNPHLGEPVIEELIHAVKEKGFVGLKLAPMVHQFSLSSEIILKLAETCGELGIPFYSHVVFSPAASTKKFAYLAELFPKTNFILGHMGFGPADVDAVEYAKNCSNIYFETSQGSHVIIKEAVNQLGSERVIFGSEFPMYHVASSLAVIQNLDCSYTELENILHHNIMNLIKIPVLC
jgi:uncharacterized protein